MALRAAQRRQLAESLLDAAARGEPLAPFSEAHPGLALADGYRIQLETLRLRRRAGGRRVGWKVGLTSAATRAELGLEAPIAGYLLAGAVWSDGHAVPGGRLIAPGVEPEIALLLGRDLAGPGIAPPDVARAVEAAVPALEIVDSRFRDWKGGLADAVADDAFAAGLVLGGALTPLHRLDLRLEGVTLEHNGRLASTAAGAAALGHPLNAVVWLANHLAELGLSLKAGDVVLTGSLTPILRPAPGDSVRAAFTRLGAVSLRLA